MVFFMLYPLPALRKIHLRYGFSSQILSGSSTPVHFPQNPKRTGRLISELICIQHGAEHSGVSLVSCHPGRGLFTQRLWQCPCPPLHKLFHRAWCLGSLKYFLNIYHYTRPFRLEGMWAVFIGQMRPNWLSEVCVLGQSPFVLVKEGVGEWLTRRWVFYYYYYWSVVNLQCCVSFKCK